MVHEAVDFNRSISFVYFYEACAVFACVIVFVFHVVRKDRWVGQFSPRFKVLLPIVGLFLTACLWHWSSVTSNYTALRNQSIAVYVSDDLLAVSPENIHSPSLRCISGCDLGEIKSAVCKGRYEDGLRCWFDTRNIRLYDAEIFCDDDQAHNVVFPASCHVDYNVVEGHRGLPFNPEIVLCIQFCNICAIFLIVVSTVAWCWAGGAADAARSLANETDANDTCVICLHPIQLNDVLLKLPCGHKDHSVCLHPWVRANDNCPRCRAPVDSTVLTPPALWEHVGILGLEISAAIFYGASVPARFASWWVLFLYWSLDAMFEGLCWAAMPGPCHRLLAVVVFYACYCVYHALELQRNTSGALWILFLRHVVFRGIAVLISFKHVTGRDPPGKRSDVTAHGNWRSFASSSAVFVGVASCIFCDAYLTGQSEFLRGF